MPLGIKTSLTKPQSQTVLGTTREMSIPTTRSKHCGTKEQRYLPPPQRPCTPCGGSVYGGPPISSGRYGYHFDPTKIYDTRRLNMIFSESRLTNYLGGRERAKRFEKIHTKYPEAPLPYLGPHNTMFDPHVRRGSTFVQFHQLEKICDLPDRWTNYKRKRDRTNPLYAIRGNVRYPEVIPQAKEETQDYSQFLEEQIEGTVTMKDNESQTEDPCKIEINEKSNSETKRLLTGILAIMDKSVEQDQECYDDFEDHAVKHNFQIGLNAQTQIDGCSLANESQLPHPRQHTISRVSKIMTKDLLSQSILEEMETADLAEIRAECDAIEYWLQKERLRQTREVQNLRRKVDEAAAGDVEEADLEKEIEAVRTIIGTHMKSICFTRKLFESTLSDPKLGKSLFAKEEAEVKDCIKWVTKNAGKVVPHNVRIARHLLDDIIKNANHKRGAAEYHEEDYDDAMYNEPQDSSTPSAEVEGEGQGEYEGRESVMGEYDDMDDDQRASTSNPYYIYSKYYTPEDQAKLSFGLRGDDEDDDDDEEEDENFEQTV